MKVNKFPEFNDFKIKHKEIPNIILNFTEDLFEKKNSMKLKIQ